MSRAAAEAYKTQAIMTASRANIEERNATLVGREMKILVDGHLEGGAPALADGSADDAALRARMRSVGRSYADAPEIDCSVFFESELPSGDFVEARIIGTSGYDLVAEPSAS